MYFYIGRDTIIYFQSSVIYHDRLSGTGSKIWITDEPIIENFQITDSTEDLNLYYINVTSYYNPRWHITADTCLDVSLGMKWVWNHQEYNTMTFIFSFEDKEDYFIAFCDATKSPTQAPSISPTVPSYSPSFTPTASPTLEPVPLSWIYGSSAGTACILIIWAIFCGCNVYGELMIQKTIIIKNPMILIIGIGDHDENPDNESNEVGGRLSDLPAVRIDIDNIIKLFGKNGFNFDIFPKEYYDHPEYYCA